MMIKTFKSLFYLGIFVATPCSAQWNDSFDDGSFKHNQTWNGDSTNFEVNANLQLHLNAPAVSGKSYLSTPSEVSTGAVWNFWAELDFNPSSGNYAKVYLMSDNERLDTLNGYYVRIGYTNDDISLFRQDGTVSKQIIDGRDGMLAKTINKISIQVKRSFAGEWEINCDSTGLANLSLIGSGIDTTYWNSSYFGIQCIYTATRSNKFLFDNFEVTGKRSNDTIAPKLLSYKVLNDSLLQAEFTEEITDTSLQNLSNYSLSQGFSIINIKIISSKTIEILLNTAIPCKQNTNIYFKNLHDKAGNSIADTTVQFSFCPGTLYDVLISEVMADPDPPIYLPSKEYVELYNKSGVPLDLNKWTLKVGADVINFPAIILPADSFLIITTSKGCNEFTNRLCLDNLPTNSLNNSQENIQLLNKNKTLIHWTTYDDTWYQDDLKRTGGWSLEMIDTNSPCVQKENWRVSVNNRGGTPGQVNSVSGTISDNSSFNYEQIYLPNDSTVRVFFSKPIIQNYITSAMFSTEPERKPLGIEFDSINHAFVDIIYPSPFLAGTPYKLHLSEDITDCSGNKLIYAEIPFMKPSQAEPNDILINEVMFDALEGKQEFIELYNNSNKYINTNNLKLAYKTPAASYQSAVELSERPFLLAPHSFIVCVKSAKGMNEQYYIPDLKNVAENRNFPNLNNEEGCIAIMNRQLEILEEFCYSSKMHFSLTTNVSGVSLERIKYKGLTSDNNNWHSASSTSEYATPGAVNSQFLDENEAPSEINLEYEIFSPDNDGYKDFETITYKFDKPGFVANILVFDASGRRIRIIANNQLLGSQGFFVWDGVDEKGKLAQTGIYLIYIKLHHPSGEIKEYRKTCVLSGEMKR